MYLVEETDIAHNWVSSKLWTEPWNAVCVLSLNMLLYHLQFVLSLCSIQLRLVVKLASQLLLCRFNAS